MVTETSSEIINNTEYTIKTEITQNIFDYMTITKNNSYADCEYDMENYNN